MADIVMTCVLSGTESAYRDGWSVTDPWINARTKQFVDYIMYKAFTSEKSNTTQPCKPVNKPHKSCCTACSFDTTCFYRNRSKDLHSVALAQNWNPSPLKHQNWTRAFCINIYIELISTCWMWLSAFPLKVCRPETRASRMWQKQVNGRLKLSWNTLL